MGGTIDASEDVGVEVELLEGVDGLEAGGLLNFLLLNGGFYFLLLHAIVGIIL